MPEITIPQINPADSTPAWHIYVVQLNLEKLKVGRGVIFEALIKSREHRRECSLYTRSSTTLLSKDL